MRVGYVTRGRKGWFCLMKLVEGQGCPWDVSPRGTLIPLWDRLLGPQMHPVRWPGRGHCAHSAGRKSDVWKDSGKVTKSVAEQRAEPSFPATVPDVLGKPAAGSLSPLDPKVHLEQAMLKLRARLSRSPVLQGLPASSPTAWCPPHASSPSSELPAPQEAAGGACLQRSGGKAAPLNRSLCGSSDTRSRLADFHANCRASYQTLTSCPADNYQACLGSYAGMIGKPPPCAWAHRGLLAATVSRSQPVGRGGGPAPGQWVDRQPELALPWRSFR